MLMMNARGWLAIAVWVVFGLICWISGPAKATEPVRLVVTLNCDDIRAIAQWKGWDELERRARAAGASDRQIEDAKRCLSS